MKQKEKETLNELQVEAVTSPFTSPLLVVAGPGTGKTRVITERVKHMIKNGVKPSEILCLTFSEKATLEMLERLETEFDVSELKIRTFHAFAYEILDENVLESGIGISGGIMSQPNELIWALNNIDKFGFEHIDLGNDPYKILEAMINGIDTFKNELVTYEELQKYLENKSKDKNLENDPVKQTELGQLKDLQKIYSHLQKFLKENRLIDLDDMVMHAVHLLKQKPLILSKYQKQIKYVLMDEFQDTNYAQFELAKLLAENGQVTAVGDEDQSIYRFQGAYSSIFDDFRKNYTQNLKEIILQENYRSTQNIVHLASKLLENSPNRTPKKIRTDNEEGSKTIVAQCNTDISEVNWIRKKIQSLLGTEIKRRDGTTSSITPKDITILTRTKRDGKKFAVSLNSYGIPAAFVGDAELFSSSIGRDLTAYLEIADNPSTAGIAINRILKIHGISELNISKINHFARKLAKSCSYSDYLYEAITSENEFDIDQKDELDEISKLLKNLAELQQHNTISQTVHEILINVTDLYQSLTRDDKPETKKKRRILLELQNLANDFETQNRKGKLSEFIQYIQSLRNFDIEIQEGFEIPEAIRVSTIHQSKGREFPIVFIADVAQRKFPGDYRPKKFYVPDELAKGFGISSEKREFYLEEEKRLLYVAISRAQNHVFISYAKKSIGKPRLYQPSQFLKNDLFFENNSLIDVIEINSDDTQPQKTVTTKNQELEKQLKNLLFKNIEQSQFKSAIKNILDLDKVEFFEENDTLKDYNPENLLKIKSNKTIDSELVQEKIPLINKNSLHLSATQFRNYMECPKKYKFNYILKVPEPGKTFLYLGSVVHKVFEKLSLLEKDGKQTSQEIGYELLENYWDSSPYSSDFKENQDKIKAKKMIDNFLNWTDSNPNKVIGVEIPFQFSIEGIPIRGKIDRLEQDSDGNYHVIDYKTGACYESETSISENVQMNLYAMAVEEKFKKLPVRASLFYVKEDKMIKYLITGKKSVDNFKENLEKMVHQIIDEKFETNPVKGAWTCKFCPYKNICDEAPKS